MPKYFKITTSWMTLKITYVTTGLDIRTAIFYVESVKRKEMSQHMIPQMSNKIRKR